MSDPAPIPIRSSIPSGAAVIPDQGLEVVGRFLQASGYAFTTVTPETHRRILERDGERPASDLRDVFGWNRRFPAALLPLPILDALRASGALAAEDDLLRSRVRFSTLDGLLFAHSCYPTTATDAVFFGPDTYRFAALLAAEVGQRVRTIVDIGCGSGAGGILLASRCERLLLTDINVQALAFACLNARLNGVTHATTLVSDVLNQVSEPVDLIIANPPYIIDPSHRRYRDGGGRLGTGLAARILGEGLTRLHAGGRLLLYTGTPVIQGQHVFHHEVAAILQAIDGQVDYRELDPDVFGEELAHPAYGECERLAVVALSITLASPVQRSRLPPSCRNGQP